MFALSTLMVLAAAVNLDNFYIHSQELGGSIVYAVPNHPERGFFGSRSTVLPAHTATLKDGLNEQNIELSCHRGKTCECTMLLKSSGPFAILTDTTVACTKSSVIFRENLDQPCLIHVDVKKVFEFEKGGDTTGFCHPIENINSAHLEGVHETEGRNSYAIFTIPNHAARGVIGSRMYSLPEHKAHATYKSSDYYFSLECHRSNSCDCAITIPASWSSMEARPSQKIQCEKINDVFRPKDTDPCLVRVVMNQLAIEQKGGRTVLCYPVKPETGRISGIARLSETPDSILLTGTSFRRTSDGSVTSDRRPSNEASNRPRRSSSTNELGRPRISSSNPGDFVGLGSETPLLIAPEVASVKATRGKKGEVDISYLLFEEPYHASAICHTTKGDDGFYQCVCRVTKAPFAATNQRIKCVGLPGAPRMEPLEKDNACELHYRQDAMVKIWNGDKRPDGDPEVCHTVLLGTKYVPRALPFPE